MLLNLHRNLWKYVISLYIISWWSTMCHWAYVLAYHYLKAIITLGFYDEGRDCYKRLYLHDILNASNKHIVYEISWPLGNSRIKTRFSDCSIFLYSSLCLQFSPASALMKTQTLVLLHINNINIKLRYSLMANSISFKGSFDYCQKYCFFVNRRRLFNVTLLPFNKDDCKNMTKNTIKTGWMSWVIHYQRLSTVLK